MTFNKIFIYDLFKFRGILATLIYTFNSLGMSPSKIISGLDSFACNNF